MANSWFRVWHGIAIDPKWGSIARASGQSIPVVKAIYLHLLDDASQNVTRGVTTVTDEDIATANGIDDEAVAKVREAMQGRVLDGDYLKGWEKRQPKREDGAAEQNPAKSGAQRQKDFRDRRRMEKDASRNVTESNAASRSVTQDNAASHSVTADKDTDADKNKEQQQIAPVGADVVPPLVLATPPAAEGVPAVEPPPGDEPEVIRPPKKKTRNRYFGVDVSTFDWVPQEPWSEYVKMRVRTKHPLTEYAQALELAQLRKLIDAGHDATEVLNCAVRKTWRGLYPPTQDIGPRGRLPAGGPVKNSSLSVPKDRDGYEGNM